MTTQELRSYIDRILGNSLRVLLPSYWWKRLFGATLDVVEDVKNTTKTLQKEVDKKATLSETIVLDWSTTELTDLIEGAIYSIPKDSYGNIAETLTIKDDLWSGKERVGAADDVAVTVWFKGKTKLSVKKWNEEVTNWVRTPQNLNLSNLDKDKLYRYQRLNVWTSDNSFIPVYTITEYSDGQSWYDSALSETSTNAVQNKAITAELINVKNKLDKFTSYERRELYVAGFNGITSLSSSQKEYNLETVALAKAGLAHAKLNVTVDTINVTLTAYAEFFSGETSWFFFRPPEDLIKADPAYRFMAGYYEVKVTSTGTTVFESHYLIPDAAISDTSENPVQNKVIKAYVDNAIANAGGRGGSSVLRMWYNEENTDEQTQENIQVYNKLVSGEPIDVLITMEGDRNSIPEYYFLHMDSYYIENEVANIWTHEIFYELKSLIREDYHFLLYADGSWDIA